MFQDAEADPTLSQAEFKKLERQLRVHLVNEQYRHLNLRDRALLILVAGIDGAGKGETINLLNEWMDPRHIHTIAFPEPTKRDQIYPTVRRFWMKLPQKGEIAIAFGSGYTSLFRQAAKKKINHDQLERDILAIRHFESTLVANDIQVIKLWFHLSRQAQHQRIESLLAHAWTAWQVNQLDLTAQKKFKAIRRAGQLIIESTDAPHAPWTIIPSADPHVRAIRTAQTILQALQAPRIKVPLFHDPGTLPALTKQRNPLDQINFQATLSKDDYEAEMFQWQNRLAQAVRSKRFKHQALVIVFEGADAAGKGGAIRRITRAIDARQFNIMPVAAPSPPELLLPYLWRFWKNIPSHGRISIFDRSWYGRVLVERVEKLISRPTWTRAYTEINDFETQLAAHGILVLKFWLAITPEEQLKRFRERENSPYKQFKITSEDWRNRRKWTSYQLAARDMFRHTDHSAAPWHVLSANDKRHARVEILKRIVLALENHYG
jgi:polyphosphate:AMP phosphotransferase